MSEVPTSTQELSGLPVAAPPPAGSGGKASFAVVSLTLGILSIPFVFCCHLFSAPSAGIAILLGWLELQAIREGKSPPSNHNAAKAGLILGIVGLCLSVLYIVLIILILGLNLGLNPDFNLDFLRNLKIQ